MNTERKINQFLKLAGTPLLLLAVLLSLLVIWQLLDLPPEKELIKLIRSYFDKYGLTIILLSAIIEGILLAGLYYPGSLVIFLGVIFAGKNILAASQIVITVIIGLYIAYIFDYALGKYGWYKLLLKFGLREQINNAREKLTKYGAKGIFLSYWMPNLAAFISTAAGILHIPFKKFALYSATAVVLWNSFWGILVYVLGENALEIVGIKFALIIVALWILYKFAIMILRNQFGGHSEK